MITIRTTIIYKVQTTEKLATLSQNKPNLKNAELSGTPNIISTLQISSVSNYKRIGGARTLVRHVP